MYSPILLMLFAFSIGLILTSYFLKKPAYLSGAGIILILLGLTMFGGGIDISNGQNTTEIADTSIINITNTTTTEITTYYSYDNATSKATALVLLLLGVLLIYDAAIALMMHEEI